MDEILNYHSLVLPPVVLIEILNDPLLPKKFLQRIIEIPVLESTENFWQRAGSTRAKLMTKKLKARLADTLIAQSCIDYTVSLLTRDAEFRHCEILWFDIILTLDTQKKRLTLLKKLLLFQSRWINSEN